MSGLTVYGDQRLGGRLPSLANHKRCFSRPPHLPVPWCHFSSSSRILVKARPMMGPEIRVAVLSLPPYDGGALSMRKARHGLPIRYMR
jgi:hypothetical protein